MHERNIQVPEGNIFASKGQAAPTRDYVPRLKTDEPAQIESVSASPLAEAQPLPEATGALGGLIRRRTAPQLTVNQPDQAARAAAERAERDTADITQTVAEQIDNGLLYESLRLGLPLPKLSQAATTSGSNSEPPATFEEAARERLAHPTESEPNDGVSAHKRAAPTKTKRKRKAYKNPNRVQLTARLSTEDFDRFKIYAADSGRTYQDILTTATTSYLDEVAPVQTPSTTEKPAQGAAEQPKTTAPDSANDPAFAVKSPYDWFRKD